MTSVTSTQQLFVSRNNQFSFSVYGHGFPEPYTSSLPYSQAYSQHVKLKDPVSLSHLTGPEIISASHILMILLLDRLPPAEG